MALKFLGELARASVFARHLGLASDSNDNVLHAVSKSPNAENLSVEAPKDTDFSFKAPQNCHTALQRGFYFSLRLPDWARDFKQQTREIFTESLDSERSKSLRESSKYEYYNNDNSYHRYGMIFSESVGGRLFEWPSKHNRPARCPKIKDDVTCGKRVSPS